MNHRLSLEIPDVSNGCIIRVEDSSSYESMLPTDCPTLEITAPGFHSPIVLTNILPGFIANLTACNLGLQTTNCDNFTNNLQDGVYIVKWSLSPNDKLFVEYNHLRITAALNRYQEVLCCIQRAIDCTPSKETHDKIKEAQFIRTLLDVAKAKVEYCHEPIHGINTYKYSMERLHALGCGCGCFSGNFSHF